MASPGSTDTGGEWAIALPEPLVAPSRAKSRALAAVRARPRWWVELLIVGWLLWVYDIVNNLAHLRYSLAIAHATDVLHLEQTLRIDPEGTLNRWMAHHHTLGVVSSYYYDNAHFVVTLGLLGWLWWRRADIYRPMRSALVLMNVIGLAVFWLYPVAPPRMLAGFTDVVANTGAVGSWHTGPLAHDANQLAAMPSLHMAWAAWCGLVLWQLSPRVWVRAPAVLYPCLTCLAVLGTGNHFVLDILAGLATAALAVVLAQALRRALPAAGSACHKLVTKSQIR
ncbi:MAG: phosphatase PAP2 family protein [Solirubrobacterales bacterium]